MFHKDPLLTFLLWEKLRWRLNEGNRFQHELSLFEQWDKCDPVTFSVKQGRPFLLSPSEWLCGPNEAVMHRSQHPCLHPPFWKTLLSGWFFGLQCRSKLHWKLMILIRTRHRLKQPFLTDSCCCCFIEIRYEVTLDELTGVYKFIQWT